MILMNWYRMICYGSAVYATYAVSGTGIKNSEGSERTFTRLSSSSFQVQKALSEVRTTYGGGASDGTNGAVVFGDGDTPVTADDYCLSGNIITGIAAKCTVTSVYNEASPSVTARITVTNKNSEEITIKECGLILPIIINSHTPSSVYAFQYYNLCERTVLDTPVTIPAGGVGQVEYTITFNLPTAAADADADAEETE